MKKIIISIVIVVVAVLFLGSLVKTERFLEVHYDTLEKRNLERISFFGIDIKESVVWSRAGYREQYREIFGADPAEDRWHSISKRPIRSTWLLTESHWSVMTPSAVSQRNSIAKGIFERYDRDHSVGHAKEAFADLEVLLPSSEQLEELDHEGLRSIRKRAAEFPALSDLVAPKCN